MAACNYKMIPKYLLIIISTAGWFRIGVTSEPSAINSSPSTLRKSTQTTLKSPLSVPPALPPLLPGSLNTNRTDFQIDIGLAVININSSGSGTAGNGDRSGETQFGAGESKNITVIFSNFTGENNHGSDDGKNVTIIYSNFTIKINGSANEGNGKSNGGGVDNGDNGGGDGNSQGDNIKGASNNESQAKSSNDNVSVTLSAIVSRASATPVAIPSTPSGILLFLDICNLIDQINCIGISANISLPDPDNCTQYFRCSGRNLYPQACPVGWQFNYLLRNCSKLLTGILSINCQPACSNFDFRTLIVPDGMSTSKPTVKSTFTPTFSASILSTVVSGSVLSHVSDPTPFRQSVTKQDSTPATYSTSLPITSKPSTPPALSTSSSVTSTRMNTAASVSLFGDSSARQESIPSILTSPHAESTTSAITISSSASSNAQGTPSAPAVPSSSSPTASHATTTIALTDTSQTTRTTTMEVIESASSASLEAISSTVGVTTASIFVPTGGSSASSTMTTLTSSSSAINVPSTSIEASLPFTVSSVSQGASIQTGSASSSSVAALSNSMSSSSVSISAMVQQSSTSISEQPQPSSSVISTTTLAMSTPSPASASAAAGFSTVSSTSALSVSVASTILSGVTTSTASISSTASSVSKLSAFSSDAGTQTVSTTLLGISSSKGSLQSEISSQVSATTSNHVTVSSTQTAASDVSRATSRATTKSYGEQHECNPDGAYNISWSLTAAGVTDIQTCILSYIGNVTRKCSVLGFWSSPDFSECLSGSLLQIISQIGQVEMLGASNATVMADIASQLLLHSSSYVDVSLPMIGDFNATVGCMRRMSNLRTTYTHPLYSEVHDVLSSVSNLLSPVHQMAWNVFNLSYPNDAVSLMRTVDIYGSLWARNLSAGESASIINDVLVLQVGAEERSALSEVSYPQGLYNVYWANSTDDQITLYQNDTNNSSRIQYISSSYYNNLNEYLPYNYYLNSRILALSVDDVSQNDIRVRFALHTIKDFGTQFKRNCVFWNYSIGDIGNWSSEGCNLTAEWTNETYTACECNHLTNFAILMSPFSNDDAKDELILSIISLVGCIISIVALFLTILLYAIRWKTLRSHHAVVIINLCIALIIANIVLLAGVDKTQAGAGCVVVAALLHYFFLAAFCVMLAAGVQLLLYVIFVFHQRRKRETALLLIAAWLIPLIIVAISLGVTKTVGYGAGYGSNSCWLSVQNGVLWAFVAPALAIIAMNIVIFILVLRRVILTKMRVTKDGTKERIKKTLWNIMVITPLLGITWIFGVLSVNQDLIVFQYIFAIVNSLQGLFIFIFHGLCNKRKSKNTDSLKPPKPSSKSSSQRVNQHAALTTNDITVIISPSTDNPVQQQINAKTRATKTNGSGAHLEADQYSLSSNSSELSQIDSDFQSIGTAATDVTSDFSGNSRERRKRSIVDSRL